MTKGTKSNNAAIAAIAFALEAEEGLIWLRLWNEGEFDRCRKEWPESPPDCFIGADQFYVSPDAAHAKPAKRAAQ
ncbi:hypothetical protein ACQUFY_26920 (plasmid) [Robbsia andropogonis]|uniref:hypothetical protein n=1 Tax=Robbsia andropogonis TaxID=28092 RepID=UPI003D1FD3F4